MRIHLWLLANLIFFSTLNAMHAQNWETPIIKGYGKIVDYENAEMLPDSTKTYKILFHIKSAQEREGVNQGLWKIARLINLMGSHGVDKDHLKIVAVVSGGATPFVLSEKAYKAQYDKSNPNLDLLSQLKLQEVKILVCGQALAKHHIEVDTDLNEYINLTLSSLIAIPSYQMEGYVLMF